MTPRLWFLVCVAFLLGAASIEAMHLFPPLAVAAVAAVVNFAILRWIGVRYEKTRRPC